DAGASGRARRHRSLARQRARLEESAIRDLFGVGRWSELDPLVRSTWSRRGALPPAERAPLAAVFSAHLFWTGSIGQAFTVANDELATLEERGALDAGACCCGRPRSLRGSRVTMRLPGLSWTGLWMSPGAPMIWTWISEPAVSRS